MSETPIFTSDYLNDYLAMVEETESPRIFHIWSALFAVSAALGRRCWLPYGIQDVYPNMYVLMVGTPGTRKSTSMNAAKRMIKQATGSRFAPSDTGFQRQGLMAALAGKEETDPKLYVDGVSLAQKDVSLMTLAELESIEEIPFEADDPEKFVDTADKHHLVMTASEFSKIIGQGNLPMLDFLCEVYDGDEVDYQTRQTTIKIKTPLLNMLACTTPTSIAIALPPQAGGQGFLSRFILVYGARKYKKVPWPTAPDLDLVHRVKDRLADVYNMSGMFELSESAREYAIGLYDYVLDISDSRFSYYAERRFSHLHKLSMCLAASRGSQRIDRSDYEEAHRILRATERGMPDALGEFGMNPLAMLKQEILEQLRASQGPLAMEQIVAMFHRDARGSEISEVITELAKLGQIKMTQTNKGTRLVSAVFTKQNTEDAMMHLLAEK